MDERNRGTLSVLDTYFGRQEAVTNIGFRPVIGSRIIAALGCIVTMERQGQASNAEGIRLLKSLTDRQEDGIRLLIHPSRESRA
jgi:hypothetical protein